jgi:hypothetical protein
MLRLRASSSYPLFTGETGLTAKQQQTLDSLLAKIKLTDKQAITRDELIVKRDAPYQLSAGARTLVEKAIEQDIWGYSPSFFSKETTKGNMVEDESILLYNRLNFTNYRKLEEKDAFYSVSHSCLSGHPDIVDIHSKKVVDIKSPWSKDTFPKTIEKGMSSQYEWQVKQYLYMITKQTDVHWQHGEIAYMLVNTPEDLLTDLDDDELHYMEDLPDMLRQTIVPVELTSADIRKIDERLEAAVEYSKKYAEQWKLQEII